MRKRNTCVIVFNKTIVRTEDLDYVPPDFDGDIVVNGNLMLGENLSLKARLFVSGDINARGTLELSYVECTNLKCSEMKADDICCNGHVYCRNIIVSGDFYCNDTILGGPRIVVLGNLTCKSIEFASTLKVTCNVETTNGGIRADKVVVKGDVICSGDFDGKYITISGNLNCGNLNSEEAVIQGSMRCINVCCNSLCVYGALYCADISTKMLMLGSTIRCYSCIAGCITSVDSHKLNT